MKKVYAIIVMGLLLVLVACGGDEEASQEAGASNEGGEVTVVLKTLSSPYWKFVEAGAKQAFEDHGIEGTVIGPSSEDQVVEQVNMLEDTLSRGTGALVLAASQPDTAIPVLEQYHEQDIPVLLIDTDIDWDKKTTFIGTENYEAGQEAGKLLAELLNEGDEIALIRGALGNPATDNRIDGAKDFLEENGFEIVADQPADSDRNKGMSVMENILQSNPNVKAVYAANDDMALGALRAVQAEGLDIPVIGTDGTIEAVESIIAGELAGSIAQNPYEMGYIGVTEAINAMEGSTIDKRIDSGVDVITSENASEKLDELNEMMN